MPMANTLSLGHRLFQQLIFVGHLHRHLSLLMDCCYQTWNGSTKSWLIPTAWARGFEKVMKGLRLEHVNLVVERFAVCSYDGKTRWVVGRHTYKCPSTQGHHARPVPIVRSIARLQTRHERVVQTWGGSVLWCQRPSATEAVGHARWTGQVSTGCEFFLSMAVSKQSTAWSELQCTDFWQDVEGAARWTVSRMTARYYLHWYLQYE